MISAAGILRLTGGTYTTGRAEICRFGSWGTICDTQVVRTGWPRTFCIYLGFQDCSSVARVNEAGLGQVHEGLPINWHEAVNSQIGEGFQIKSESGVTCTHADDIAITCQPP